MAPCLKSSALCGGPHNTSYSQASPSGSRFVRRSSIGSMKRALVWALAMRSKIAPHVLCNAPEVRVMLHQDRGNPHRTAAQECFQLQGVHCGLSQIVIVGDGVRFL